MSARKLTPSFAPPCQALREGIDLVIMTPGKSQQFRGEFLQPTGTSGKTNRASGKQVALRNHPSALVGFWLVNRNVDRSLTQALDETATDGGILDQKGGRAVALFDLHHLAFERVERKAAAYHLENVEDFFAPEQHD